MSSHIHGQTLSRSDLAALNGCVDRTLSECVFDHADVSGLDLNGERCSFKGADFVPTQTTALLGRGLRLATRRLARNATTLSFRARPSPHIQQPTAMLTSSEIVSTGLHYELRCLGYGGDCWCVSSCRSASGGN